MPWKIQHSLLRPADGRFSISEHAQDHFLRSPDSSQDSRAAIALQSVPIGLEI